MSVPSFSELLEKRENIILITDNTGVHDFMLTVMLNNRSVSYVSDSFPLLSNLNVIENITLFSMFHENETLEQAAAKVAPFVGNLGMQDAILKRKESLSREEIIGTYILRAISRGSEIIITDFTRSGDLDILISSLKKIGKRLFLWIMCREKEIDIYSDFDFKRIRLAGLTI